MLSKNVTILSDGGPAADGETQAATEGEACAHLVRTVHITHTILHRGWFSTCSGFGILAIHWRFIDMASLYGIRASWGLGAGKGDAQHSLSTAIHTGLPAAPVSRAGSQRARTGIGVGLWTSGATV